MYILCIIELKKNLFLVLKPCLREKFTKLSNENNQFFRKTKWLYNF